MASEDAIWHFAQGVGDDNPLWWDPDYAGSTRWGRLMAPPLFLYTCSNAGLRVGEEGIFPAEHWLPGTVPIWVSDRWAFHRPVWAGERVDATSELVSVEERPGRDGGRAATHVDRTSYVGEDGSLIAECFKTRQPLRPAAGRDGGARTRRRPCRPTATTIGGHRRASTSTRCRPAGREHALRRRGPRRSGAPGAGEGPADDHRHRRLRDGLGLAAVPDEPHRQPLSRRTPRCPPARRPHERRRHVGGTALGAAPGTQGRDGGLLRLRRSARLWLGHLLTDWCGDDGFVSAMEVRLRRPNLVGDTTWLGGEVLAVRESGPGDNGDGGVLVDCALRATNQRGEETATGTATVRLPRRAGATSTPPG